MSNVTNNKSNRIIPSGVHTLNKTTFSKRSSNSSVQHRHKENKPKQSRPHSYYVPPSRQPDKVEDFKPMYASNFLRSLEDLSQINKTTDIPGKPHKKTYVSQNQTTRQMSGKTKEKIAPRSGQSVDNKPESSAPHKTNHVKNNKHDNTTTPNHKPNGHKHHHKSHNEKINKFPPKFNNISHMDGVLV